MFTHPKISTTLCLHSSSARISMLLSDRLLTLNLKANQQINKTMKLIQIFINRDQKGLCSFKVYTPFRIAYI